MSATSLQRSRTVAPRFTDVPDTKGVLYIRGLPVDVKAQFKAACARRGLSMTERIEELIRLDIKPEKVS